MKRRDFLRTTTASSLLLGLQKLGVAQTPAPDKKKMNVLFIMSDDLDCRLNTYGYPVHSPNLDRLAAKGMRFDQAYCQYPVCNPSRSSMLTGLRPDVTTVLSNEKKDTFRGKMPDVVTIPQLFRQNGYYTASVGKIIHNGLDAQGHPAGFQDPKSWEFCTGIPPNYPPGQTEDLSSKLIGGSEGKTWCWWRMSNGSPDEQPDAHSAATTIKLIEDHKDQPFFIADGFVKPHVPYVATKEFFDLYPPEEVKLPEEPPDRSPFETQTFLNAKEYENFTPEDRLHLKRAYYAAASLMDAQVGKLLNTLDRLNLWDNTIVVFVADHGYHLWEHNWHAKDTLYEQSTRVSLIIWAPGCAGMGKSTRGIAEELDIYPTLAELCGLTPPSVIQGTSLVPLLNDPSGPGKEGAYTEVWREGTKENPKERALGYTVRTDQYRYTEWPDGGAELYDHAKDPGEYYNLARSPDHQDVVAKLQPLLHKVSKAPKGVPA